MRRAYAGLATRVGTWLVVLGVVLFLLSGLTLAYSRWSEWQYELRRPAGPPQEILPERLSVPTPAAARPGDGDGDGDEGAPGPRPTPVPASTRR